MEIKINPRAQFRGYGPCVEMVGEWVTQAVWSVVRGLLLENRIDSSIYQARTKAGAFFQGGHHDPHGEWILIEFSASEVSCQDFIRILNTEVNKVIDPDYAVIRVIAKSNNALDLDKCKQVCDMIADETKCHLATEGELATMHCSAAFLPKDNIQYAKVQSLLDYTFCRDVRRLHWVTTGQQN